MDSKRQLTLHDIQKVSLEFLGDVHVFCMRKGTLVISSYESKTKASVGCFF